MESKKYPNNACCYYVSWENIPLTSSLFLLENFSFLTIWACDLQIPTLVSNIFIIYMIISASSNLLCNKSLTSRESCEKCSECYAKSFELIYDKVNSGCDWLRKNSLGSKGIFLAFLLFLLRTLNPSIFSLMWIGAMWSFVEPASIKFLGVNPCELCKNFNKSNPISDQIKLVYELIPRASSVRKSQ